MSVLPLSGMLVLDFSHAIMGPACAQMLGDMGAEVIHIESPQGDPTRDLKGMGLGYFPFYSRNKKSLAIDLKTEEGRQVIYALAKRADVVVENFGPGTMDRLGLGYDQLAPLNERLIYTALKGFLPGPYEKRHAMDEVVQMMGGIAYMTGPPGQPMRAGISVIDVTGGMFATIGTLLALYEREVTGTGKLVKSALFETAAYLMGQNMVVSARSGLPVPPMPARVNAWSIYNTFQTGDDQIVFIGVISEKHWERFCRAFDRIDWLEDTRFQTNNDRLAQGDAFMLPVREVIRQFSKDEIMARCESAGLPYAPINRPEDLMVDPHLNQGAGMVETVMPEGMTVKLPRLPFEYGGESFGLRLQPPEIGSHNAEILASVGILEDAQADWKTRGIIP